MPALPLIIGATALAAGTAAGGAASGNALESGKDRKMLRKDRELLAQEVEAMETGQLGLSEAQRQQMLQEQNTQAQQAAAAQQRDIARQQLAATGDFQADAFANAQQQVAAQTQQAAAQASADVQDLSAQIREREQNRVRAQIAAAAERRRQANQFWVRMGVQGVMAALGAPGAAVPNANTGPSVVTRLNNEADAQGGPVPEEALDGQAQ